MSKHLSLLQKARKMADPELVEKQWDKSGTSYCIPQMMMINQKNSKANLTG